MKTKTRGRKPAYARSQVLKLTIGHMCRYGGDDRLLEGHCRELAKLLREERLAARRK